MKRSNTNRALVLAAAVAATTFFSMAQAAVVTKANNTDALNLTTSWVGGVVPGSGDIATWDSTYTQTTALSLGSDLTWSGINFVGVPNGFTFNGGNTITLGSDGFTTNINKNYTLNNGFTLAADQTWSIANGVTVFGGPVDLAGYTLTLGGAAGTRQFKTTISGGGQMLITTSQTKFSNATTASGTDITVTNGGTLNFDVNSGTLVRAGSLTLQGRNNLANVSVTAATNGDQIDQIAGALTIAPGGGIVTITPNANYNARIEAGSLDRQAGGSVLFRGTNLGSAAGANVANVKFGSAPTLSGTGTSGNTIGIIKGAIGGTTAAGTGYGTTGGLVTYDSANGVRLLGAGEYQAGITDGQGYEATPVYVNASIENSSGALSTTTLNSNTAVNSLSLKATTTAGSGITITGPGSLKVNSGVVYATQTIGASATNAINIETPVDLNGQEGVIFANTAGMANSTTTGRLEFKNAISNGSELTKAGPGEVRFSGTAANTYSGTTYVNEGVLTFAKTTGVNAIGGDLVVNGGRVQYASSNQIADTANVTINSGTFSLQYSNSGSVYKETFNNLTMNGGTYTTGTAGHDGASNILGTMTLNAGAINMSASDDVTVSGLATFSGGTQSISPSNSATVYNTIVTFNGGLAINNIAAGAYTPLTLQSSATNKGAKLVLGGDVAFTGNATNSNTVTIAAGSLANLGYIDLGGATRTFNIGDGAAGDDLTVNPIIDNGGITKTGAGTLVLGGANTYTGGTTVNAGKLVVNGSLASAGTVSITGTGSLGGSGAVGAVTVGAGGKLTPGNSPGSQSYASLALADGGHYVWEINSVTGLAGTNWDQIVITGGLTLPSSGIFAIDVTGLTGVGDAPLANTSWDIMTYASLAGTFDPAKFQINTTGLNGTWNGTWSLVDTGTSIQAVYSIPEPATIALAAAVGGFALLRRRTQHA